jgi:hypothetical protein
VLAPFSANPSRVLNTLKAQQSPQKMRLLDSKREFNGPGATECDINNVGSILQVQSVKVWANDGIGVRGRDAELPVAGQNTRIRAKYATAPRRFGNRQSL